jgi:Trk K+ transport system NAD-binding subunit
VYNHEREEFSIPRGKQVINEGDELFLISAAENIKKAVDFLTAKNKA